MNDTELISVGRESFADVHSTTTAEQIVRRGRAVRTRRRVSRVAAAVGAAGAAAVAVTAALPASHPAADRQAANLPTASHPASHPAVQLAAWTVTRQADDTIKVTFREATDAAGLQHTLRADGVPASVTFTGQQNPACRPYTPSQPSRQPWGWPLSGVLNGPQYQHNPRDAYTSPYALVIHPSQLPSGAGLQIWTSGTPGAADNFQLNVGLVQASPQCTGS
jgi:hypothetical protein